MTADEFWDNWSYISCKDCAFYHPKCKRIDHHHFTFGRPWFQSEHYSCGIAGLCRDFQPTSTYPWLYHHWIGWDEWVKGFNRKFQDVALCIDGDQSVRYYVSWKDFAENTFLNSDGKLKWMYKRYYKKSKHNPIGYRLITEYNSKYPSNIKKVEEVNEY